MKWTVISLITFFLAMSPLAAETLGGPERIYGIYAPAVATLESAAPECPTSRGTGFFVSADGLFVTNKHVVACALRRPGGTLTIRWPRPRALGQNNYTNIIEYEKIANTEMHESKNYRVALCGKTQARDLCLLQVTVPGWPAESPLPSRWFKISSRTLTPGATVYTIGNAGGHGLTLKSGSFLGTRNHDGVSEIATSIPTIPGNSGGPIFTEGGEVVGVHYLHRFAYSPLVPKDLRTIDSEKNGIAAMELDRLMDQFFRDGARTLTPDEFQQRVAPTLDW